LLSECEVLQRQLPLRANRGPQCPNEDRKPSHHIRSIADQSRQPQDNRAGRVLRKDKPWRSGRRSRNQTITLSRGPRANRLGSAHGVPFVGMRGSLPRAPACAGARFSGSRRRSRLLADPLRRSWRPRWRSLHSHPLLLAVCVPTRRDPRPVPSCLRSLQPGVNRQWRGT